MVQPKEQEIREKYRLLPKALQNILNSPVYFGMIGEISEKFDLDEEDSKVLTASVGLGLLGFIKPQELFQEINDYLEADEKTVVEMIREVNRQIFIPLHQELEKLYEIEGHLEGLLEKEETEPILSFKPKEKPETQGGRTESRLEVKGAPPEEGKPFILHKEESIPEEKKKPFKGFDFPFDFMRPGKAAGPGAPVRVTVETPGAKPAAKASKEEKRVVHYSGLRTPLSPFGKTKSEEEIINLETFAKTPKPKEDTPPVPASKTGPTIEGNIVDLRQQS